MHGRPDTTDPLRPSPIQTLLSAPESRRVNPIGLAGSTAGGEFHPALKIERFRC